MTIEQYKKLDSCHFEFSMDQPCQEEEIEARLLLGSNRFDLYAILLYIDHRVRGVHDMTYATNVYKERTRVMTGQKFSEKGNSEKNNFSDFINSLDKLIADFQNGQFDYRRTYIPVDKDYSLIDGAHRVACAAYFGKKLKILRFTDISVHHMTSEVLLSNFMPVTIADAMALEALQWHDNLFMLIFWPKATADQSKNNEALQCIHSQLDVIYEKKCVMSHHAIRNLMLQIYGHMEWVGNLDNDYESTYLKADQVWESKGGCRFILVQAPDKEYVLNIKSQVRAIYDIGLSSVHSTDNHRETALTANAIYNPNSFHFLHIARPTKYKKSYKLFLAFVNALEVNQAIKKNFIIDSSMVLAICGGRSANDLDYYKLTGSPDLRLDKDYVDCIEEHDEYQKKFYDVPIDDLINIPSNYFSFNEIKFVSLENLLKFKQNRYQCHHDGKDNADIKLISLLLSDKDNKWQRWLIACNTAYRRKCRMLKRDYYNTRNRLLDIIGIYEPLKQIKGNLRQKGFIK